MAVEYSLNVEIGFPEGIERAAALAVADARLLFPRARQAIDQMADMAYQKWRGYASGEVLPSGDRIRPWTGEYLASIQAEPVEEGWTIWSDDPKARVIEEGAPAWDLHQVLATSTKVRKSKKGTLYLIIPMRHGTPDAVVVGGYAGRTMPDDIYAAMREKAQTFIVGQREEPTVHYPGETVSRNIYAWGDKLTLSELEEVGYPADDPGTQRMAGMYRMAANTPNATRSTYITFRTLSENNKEGSWLIPERKGKYPAKAVYDWLAGEHEAIMEYALELDAEQLRRVTSA